MEGADKSTELLRHPTPKFVILTISCEFWILQV